MQINIIQLCNVCMLNLMVFQTYFCYINQECLKRCNKNRKMKLLASVTDSNQSSD